MTIRQCPDGNQPLPLNSETHHALRAICCAVLVVTLAVGSSQAEIDARALAMGSAQTAAARGVSAAAWNPANLAFSPGVSVRLLNASLDVYNNSFSLGRYNEISGKTLTQADKQRLLADVPRSGFRLDADAGAGTLGLQIGRFALTTGVVAAGRGNLDRDVFDLVLFGNEPGRIYHFDDTCGEGHAVGRVSLSWGQSILSGSRGQLAVGLTASYLKGLFGLQVEQAQGNLVTGMDEIRADAFLAAVTADDASGFGLDLGAAWQAPRGWTVGLALNNVLSQLDWQGTVERTEYRLTARDINLFNDDIDSGIVDSDTTYAVSGYKTSLPPILRLGAARVSGRWLVAADYVQGLRSRASTSTTPQLNLGAEWRAKGWLAPRSGISLGGSQGIGLAGGFGLQLGFWQLDLAVMQRGGFKGSSTRGLGMGFSTQLVF